MKGGLAVMVELALAVPEPAVDVTYVFYAREEIAAKESGLEELFVERPDLLEGDVAILGEPTDGEVEAGCQGTLRLEVTLAGERAHSARPWMGRNAVHRLGPLLSLLDAHEPRQPVIEGLQFREALQAVRRQRRCGHQRDPGLGHRRPEPPLRAGPRRPRRPKRRCGTSWPRCSRRATRSSWSTWRRAQPRPWTIPSWSHWSNAAGSGSGPSWAGPTWPASPPGACRP